MAKELYIEKEYKKKDKEGNITPVKTKYRIDADFEPKKPNEICVEFIINYCEKEDKNADWLEAQFKEKTTNKSGKEVEKSFYEIRKAFVEKFFPEIEITSSKLSPKEAFLKRMEAKRNK